MTIRTELEFQADRVENAFASQGIRVRISGGQRTHRWVRFDVFPRHVGNTIPAITPALIGTLTSALRMECRVERRGARVAVTALRADVAPLQFGQLYEQLYQYDDVITPPGFPHLPAALLEPPRQAKPPRLTGMIGLAEDGTPLLVRLPSEDVKNILISGEAGAGKTNLLRCLMMSLVLSETPTALRVLIVAPREEWNWADSIPHLMTTPVDVHARKVESSVRAVARLVIEREMKPQPEVFTALMFVVDGLEDVFEQPGNLAPIFSYITAHGPAVGVHVVATVERQPPGVGLFSTWGFLVRILGKTPDVQSACDLSEVTFSTAAERLASGEYFVYAEKKETRFDAPLLTVLDAALKVSELAQKNVQGLTVV